MTPKKSAKPAAVPSKNKPVTKRPPRPSLPPLSGQPDYKTAAANDVDAAPVKGKDAKESTAPAEKLGKKLRTKAEILSALHKGARVLHTDTGLYRIVATDGSQSPASKRRIVALMNQKLLVPTKGNSRTYVLDSEAERSASEDKKKSEPGQ